MGWRQSGETERALKNLVAALCVAVLCACSQGASPAATASGAVGVVQAIYVEVARHIGHDVTPLSAIPMTDDLKALMDRAQTAASDRGEPFLEGDIAANCQDCMSLTELAIGPQTGPEQVPAPQGHTIVEAKFKLNGNEERTLLYDLIETPQGWRVDNILGDGFNLRSEAQAYLVEAASPVTPPAP